MILVVEDEIAIRDLIYKILNRYGFKPVSFSNPEDGLEFFSRRLEDIDLVISDFTMPQMTGAKMTEKIKKIKPEIKVIGISGKKESEKIFQESGVNGFLLKPFSLKDFESVIRKVLAG